MRNLLTQNLKKYEYIKLKSRYFKNATLPDVYIDDLRRYKPKGALSENSIFEITECLKHKKQALIFVNRRGHTPKILCHDCGWQVSCPGCSSWLCYHQNSNQLVCHYCSFKTYLKKTCESCGGNDLKGIGSGIEKVHEEVLKLFPNSRILVLSSDTINTPNKITSAINSIKNDEVDIIIGTQIVAKGHNFNNLNLVVITCVDAMLYGEDFRGTEKAFQMLHQVSGRAGRVSSEHKAKVLIQTFNPDDEIMKNLQNNDIEKLYQNEIRNRELMNMPPFGKMASITLSAMSENEVYNFSKLFVKAAPKENHVKIMGPIQPPMFKINSRYRMRIILLSKGNLQNYIRAWMDGIKIPSYIKITIDVDPYNFL